MIFKKKNKESKPKKEKKVPDDESRHAQENRDCLMAGADCKRQLWGV